MNDLIKRISVSDNGSNNYLVEIDIKEKGKVITVPEQWLVPSQNITTEISEVPYFSKEVNSHIVNICVGKMPYPPPYPLESGVIKEGYTTIPHFGVEFLEIIESGNGLYDITIELNGIGVDKLLSMDLLEPNSDAPVYRILFDENGKSTAGGRFTLSQQALETVKEYVFVVYDDMERHPVMSSNIEFSSFVLKIE